MVVRRPAPFADMLLIVLLFAATASSAHVQICCRKASGNCRAACEELTLISRTEPDSQHDLTVRLKDFCPDVLESFWKCVDETLHKDELEDWAGRACCHLAETENCRVGCTQALQLNDLNRTCRYSDEVVLYDCAERKNKGEECCTLARSSACHSICRKSLVSRRISRQAVESQCTGPVSSCMDRLNKPSTSYMSKMGHCCLRTSYDPCREKCSQLIEQNANDVTLTNELGFAQCGPLSTFPVSDMWECFFSNEDLKREYRKSDGMPVGTFPVIGPVVNTGYPGYPPFPQRENQYPGSQFPDPNSPYPNYPGNQFPGGNQYPGGNQFPGNNQYPNGAQYPGSGNQYPPGATYPMPGNTYPGLPLNPGNQRPDPSVSRSPDRKPFTRFPSNNIAEVGMDVNKLYCCVKAVNNNCRHLCYKSYSNAWSQFSAQFYRDCLGNRSESVLAGCIDDSDEPCELGCDGLNFCTNYNKSPELFRSCNADADNAQQLFTNWTMQGYIDIPQFSIEKIQVKNISNCSPVMWKSVVCALQVKPCHKKNHSNKICREDCFSLLSSCLVPNPARGIDANSVCSQLSPTDPNEPCISLEDFLQTTVTTRRPSSSKKTKLKGTVRPFKKQPSTTLKTTTFDRFTFSPCHNHTCNAMQICVVNRFCEGSSCPPYTCQPGCKMGEISYQQVPTNSYISLMDNPNPDQPCFKMCRCTPQGNFAKCLPQFCILNENFFCFKTTNNNIGNGEVVVDPSCNQKCYCHWGDLVCDKRDCTSTPKAAPSTSIIMPSVSSQCKTANDYTPICVGNGLTLPNKEFAMCLGYSNAEYIPGACSNPCLQNPCSMGETCIHTPKVCLYTDHKDFLCPQFKCMRKGVCQSDNEPVCSTDGFVFNDTCKLVSDPVSRHLDYKGPCLGRCKKTGPICGVDGVTYDSECQANARYIKMDYDGQCRQLGASSGRVRCPGVKCPTVKSYCSRYIPPGACCPTCAGAVRVAFSHKIIGRAALALGPAATQEVFTVESVVASLERHIMVANCRLFGHLTFDGDLVLMVSPILVHLDKYHVKPCMAEAEKLAVLIDSHNPKILSVTATSPLVLATVEEIKSSAHLVSPQILMSLLPLFIYFFR